MIEKRKPWMKFYPADWQADEGLSQCSLTARGLWIEMIATMHKSSRYGHLLIAGVQPSVDHIAKQVGSDVKTVRAAIAELEQWRVLSRTADGTIFSRRMVKDAEKAEADFRNGKGGGNPTLKGGDNPQGELPVKGGVNPPAHDGDNPMDNGGDKAQRPEARVRERKQATRASPLMPTLNDEPAAWLHLTPTSEVSRDDGKPHATAGGWYVDAAAALVCEAARMDGHTPGMDWRPMLGWLAEGLDLHAQILPAIRDIAARPTYKPPRFLSYFDHAIRTQRAA